MHLEQVGGDKDLAGAETMLQRALGIQIGGEVLLGDGSSSLSEEEEKVFALAERTAARWGTPLAEPTRGQCRRCAWFVFIDGEGHLLDYGVCTSSESMFDGKAVHCTSGCPAYVVSGRGDS